MDTYLNREIHLLHRPEGMPGENDFKLVEQPMPVVEDGHVLVRNIYMSVDPYMRGRMIDRKSYVPPFQINQPLEGGCVGQVVESKNDKFGEGDLVLGFKGWREYYTSDGSELMTVDGKIAPLQSYLGVIGMPGFTAYHGLLEIGRPKEGETVFVSAAAGAVGSVACQVAKLKGCKVLGSAGSEQKVSWLVEKAGIDAAFNYKNVDDLVAEVARHCPQGIDIYFENVGGKHLEAALENMNDYGRVVMCGAISIYNATEPPPGPSNLFYTVMKKLTLKGFIISDHFDKHPQFINDMSGWIADGTIKWEETIVQGLENAPRAFMGLFKGENFGKMIVQIGPDPTAG